MAKAAATATASTAARTAASRIRDAATATNSVATVRIVATEDRNDRNNNRGGAQPLRFEAKPPRKEKPIDPDSPLRQARCLEGADEEVSNGRGDTARQAVRASASTSGCSSRAW